MKQGFSVRWQDEQEKWHSKDYADLATARKAVAWLEANGGIAVDIAMILVKKNQDQPDEQSE